MESREKASTSNATGDSHQNNATQEWNHFTTPLNPTRESPPLPDNNNATTALPKDKYNPSPASVFSDLERSQTVDKFVNVFTEHIGNAMSSGKLSQAWQQSSGGSTEGEDYAAERRTFQPHFTPFIWGSSCMVVTLVSLRLGRWHQGKNAVTNLSRNTTNISGSSGGQSQRRTHNTLLKNARQTRSQQQQQQLHNNANNSPFNPREELKKDVWNSLNTLPVDLALSMLFGISTTIFLTRPKYLMNDFSNAPLLEGKSALAEELCIPFHNEMEKVNGQYYTYTPYNNNNDDDDTVPEQKRVVPFQELWKEENLGDFDSLRAIRDFVSNCHEREEVAKQRKVRNNDNEGVGDADGFVSEQELLEAKIEDASF